MTGPTRNADIVSENPLFQSFALAGPRMLEGFIVLDDCLSSFLDVSHRNVFSNCKASLAVVSIEASLVSQGLAPSLL